MHSAVLLLLVGCLSLAAGTGVRAGQDDATPVLESEDLVVLLARVKQQLERTNDRALRNLLRLDYYITVYGKSPQLEYIASFDMHRSPVPDQTVPYEHTEIMRAMRLNTVYPRQVPMGANPVSGWAWRTFR